MKNIWKPEDIVAGLYIIKETSPKGSNNLNFACTVTFKVGYSNSDLKKYGLISCMTDGWYHSVGSKEELAEKLNEDKAGYRPLTKDEFFNMLVHTNQGFY